MNINIKAENARFIVNREKRTVVCVIEMTHDLFIRFMEDNFILDLNEWSRPIEKLHKRLRMPNKFIGKAVCSEDDPWDEEIGKLIAFNRAKNNLEESFFKRAQLYVDTLDSWLDDAFTKINRYGIKVKVNAEHREQRIAELLGDKE